MVRAANETAVRDATDGTWMLPSSPATGILQGMFSEADA